MRSSLPKCYTNALFGAFWVTIHRTVLTHFRLLKILLKFVRGRWLRRSLNTLRPIQNGCHFPDDIFKCVFLNGNVWISIRISLNFVSEVPIDNEPSLLQMMAWSRPGVKAVFIEREKAVLDIWIQRGSNKQWWNIRCLHVYIITKIAKFTQCEIPENNRIFLKFTIVCWICPLCKLLLSLITNNFRSEIYNQIPYICVCHGSVGSA